MKGNKQQLQKTTVATVATIAGVAALFGVVTTLSFYGNFPTITVISSTVLWLLAALCLVVGVVVRKRIANGEIGLDRSQLNPMTVAAWMVIGKSAALLGAGFSGFYVGVGVYVLPRMRDLVAAAQDVPGILAWVLGGLATCLAGLFLERSCLAPPPVG